jgi:hypothetical protein
MRFIALGRLMDEPIGDVHARRAFARAYEVPDGVTVLAQYVLACSNPRIVTILETDDPRSLMGILAAWEGHFDFTIVPAVTAEEILGPGVTNQEFVSTQS